MASEGRQAAPEGGNDGSPTPENAAPTPEEIKARLLTIGEREDRSVGEGPVSEGEVQGAEHLQAAEGAMTFQGLTSEDADEWMDKRLSSIAKDYKTGPSRPKRREFVRRVIGA